MMKKGLTLFAALVILGGAGSTCQAQIIPAYGYGQTGLSAVVLCESLSARQEAGGDSQTVSTLHYGDKIIVMDQKDGWAQCALSDSVDAGPACWVNAEFLAIDPAWYQTDDTTPVYAWNDTAACKVAELDKGVVLPILKEDGEWLVVSLRGAAGWIRKTEADVTPAAGQTQEATEQAAASSSGSQSGSSASGSQSGSSSSGSQSGGTDASAQTSQPGSYYGEGAGLEDIWGEMGYSQNTDTSSQPGSYYGEGAGLEDNWADYGYSQNSDSSTSLPGSYYGEGAGLEDNWADYSN